MQETKTRAPADEEPPTPRPSWIRIVAIAVALAMLGGVLYATWQTVASSGTDPEANESPGAGVAEPDFSLTDEEAIERFKDLEASQIASYEKVDITSVSDFAGPGSFKDKVVKELRQLKRDDVYAILAMKDQVLEVTANTPEEISIEETVTLNIKFRDSSGGDVTSKGKPQRLVVDWTLEPFERGWLLTESTAIDTLPIK
ncbi:MAG: hypothetical protein ACRDK3_07235 [Actinomycetota bacterium]